MGRQSRNRKHRRTPADPPPGPRPSADYPVARVLIDGEPWEVDGTPVQGGGAGNFRTTRVARRTDTAFVLAPTFGARLIGLVFVAFGAVIIGGPVYGLATNGPKVPPFPSWEFAGAVAVVGFVLLLGGMTIGVSLGLLTRTTRFDKETGRMTTRVAGRTTTDRSLRDVVAVQCLFAGRASGRGGRYDVFQLNLVVLDGPDQRVNLRTEPDGEWVRATAADLAGFLGVPLADQLAESRAAWERRPSALGRLFGRR